MSGTEWEWAGTQGVTPVGKAGMGEPDANAGNGAAANGENGWGGQAARLS